MNNFVVVGIGPMGGILSAHLLRAGHQVTLIDILEDRLSSIAESGLSINDPNRQLNGDFSVRPTKFLKTSRDIEEKPDCVFVSTKTYGLMNVIENLAKRFSSDINVVIYQNGLDNEEYAAQVLGSRNVMRSINNFAGMMTSDTEVKVTFFNRPNYIGVIDESLLPFAKELAGILSDAGLETEFTPHIKKPEWDKVILNSCLAPVSAVTGLTMKEVLDSPPLKQMVENLLEEGLKVAREAGIEFPDDFYEKSIGYLSKGGYHKPSMLVDIESGRETEIDYFNGRIAEYGERLGVGVPHNRMITSLLKGLEIKNFKASTSTESIP